MAEQHSSRVWLMRVLYVGLVIALIFMHLLPLESAPSRIAPPDVIIALTFAWAMRRPEYVPALSVGLVALLADLLLQRPPGLMAALTVIGAETLRARAQSNREVHFMIEWATVAGVIIAVSLTSRIALSTLIVPTAPWGMALLQTALTIAIYPIVVLISRFLFGVSKPAPGEINAMGQRI